MMNPIQYKIIRPVWMSALVTFSMHGVGEAQAPASALENRGQETDQWSWAAVSEMILDWSSLPTNQPAIADWAVDGLNAPNYLNTGLGGIGPFINPFTDETYFKQGIKQILTEFGDVQSERLPAALSLAEAQGQLDAGKPFVILQNWRGGGGHSLVVRDYSQSVFSVEDPWPLDGNPQPGNDGVSAAVSYASLLGVGPVPYSQELFGGTTRNTWRETLKLGNSLDIVFLIDSTGSMGSYIANVQSQASNLLLALKAEFDDLRVAIVDYRDFPAPPWGETTDYITKVGTPFTTDIPTAVSAINSIEHAGGADFPEAVFSAVYQVSEGSIIGGWRPGDGVARHVILMGDAPGHSPELWVGGKSISDSVGELLRANKFITLHALAVGNDPEAQYQFGILAGDSKGKFFATDNASEVSDLIFEVISDIARKRMPVGDYPRRYPTFQFDAPGGPVAASPAISALAIEVEAYHPERGWLKHRRIRVRNMNAREVVLKQPLRMGEFRWRLFGKTRGANYRLPDGSLQRTDPGHNFVEGEFTEFNRLSQSPGSINKLSSTFLYSSSRNVEVMFEDNPDALSFAILVIDESGRMQVRNFRRNQITRSFDGKIRVLLRVRPNQNFSWYVQGLNHDRKRPEEAAWE